MKVKKYKLEIGCMEDEFGATKTLYSHGHHDEDKFREACEKSGYMDNIQYPGSYIVHEVVFTSEIKKEFAKVVGWFEGRERLGHSHSYSKTKPENGRGWFPITYACLERVAKNE